MSVNKAIIVGRLGQDPELRFTQSGKAFCNLSIATDQVWKDKSGQQQKKTEWHKVAVWAAQAEACGKYLSKGREVYVEGRIETRSYDDKEGNKRYVTEIIAERVQFIGGQRGGQQDSGQFSDDGGPGGDYDDDIPY